MKRVCLIVLDSLGIGGCPEAHAYYNQEQSDYGSDTLGHIQTYVEHAGARGHAPFLANLRSWGLFHAHAHLHKDTHRPPSQDTKAAWGYAKMQTKGKDTLAGHWEISGCILDKAWHTFPDANPSVPKSFVDTLAKNADLPGFLGNHRASGTAVIQTYGAQHLKEGKPILYTSADSVLQIAAHEDGFGLTRLYDVCGEARRLLDAWLDITVGRVIARPFVGAPKTGFQRSSQRRDFTIQPPTSHLLGHVQRHCVITHGVGKIKDIFADQGVSHHWPAKNNQQACEQILKAAQGWQEGSHLIFANLNDFDTLYGHRRDVLGYAKALEYFDAFLPQLSALKDTVVILCADHGNDPTWVGSDHTREQVPILFYDGRKTSFLGARDSLADIGQTVCSLLAIPPLLTGKSFL